MCIMTYLPGAWGLPSACQAPTLPEAQRERATGISAATFGPAHSLQQKVVLVHFLSVVSELPPQLLQFFF